MLAAIGLAAARLHFKDVLPAGLSLLEPTVDRRWAKGTHVMHLERNRRSLYESVAAFIAAVEASH